MFFNDNSYYLTDLKGYLKTNEFLNTKTFAGIGVSN